MKAEHNVVVDGKKGVIFHVDADISGCNGRDCKCWAWLFYANGKPVKDTNGQYCVPSNGQVMTSVSFKPVCDNTHFDDLQIFIPYDEFHIKKGKDVRCYFILKIGYGDSGTHISKEYKESMSLSYGDEEVVSFKRIWLTSYNNFFYVNVHFIVNHALNKNGKLSISFYNEDGSRLIAAPNSNNKTKSGHLASKCDITPNYECCEWKCLYMFLEFSELNLLHKGRHHLKLQVSVSIEGGEPFYSDFVDFKVEVKKTLFSGFQYKLV